MSVVMLYSLSVMKKYMFLFTVVLSIAASGKEVFFVPGWRTGNSSRAGCVRIMRDIYPGYDITVKSWNSRVALTDAVKNAESCAEQLKKEITSMPEARRKQLILVGHSLGSAVVLDVLDYLAHHKMKISGAALLGTPVAADDPRLARGIEAVEKMCYNVAFSGDTLLQFLYSFTSPGKPMGVGGSNFKHPRFVEHIERNEPDLTNHFAYKYLEVLDRVVDSVK